MRTRRKTWSLPLAMVTALLLVGLLGAVVLAQSGRNAAPKIESLDDLEKRIDQPVTTIDLTEEITDATTVKVEAQNGDDVDAPEQLAVTVMTNNASRTTIALLTGAYNVAFAPVTNPVMLDITDDDVDNPETVQVPSAVAVWWDGLTDAERRGVVGARLMDDTLEDDDDEQGPCDEAVPTWCFDFDHDLDDDTDPIKRIRNYVAVSAVTDVSAAIEELEAPARTIVTQAFHWDMLSADQMLEVATAAELSDGIENAADNYNAFKDRFGGLTNEQRDEVQTLYTTDEGGPYLQRGLPADLTVVANETAIPGDDPEDNNFKDGRIGEAEVTVKVSDSYGRLIPPASGSNTVGTSFTVDVQGVRLGQLSVAAPTDADDDGVFIEPDIEPGPEDVRLITEVDEK